VSAEVGIETARGPVPCLWDEAAGATRAVVMVGGADGGFDGPAEALYPTLAEDFATAGCSALRLDFRIHQFPNDPQEGLHDLLAGLAWLRALGYERVGLIGHSFGGAVVIEAGVLASNVSSVATLATQTAGAMQVSQLAPTPLLLIHGADDTRLSPRCSEVLHELAGEPKRLVIMEGATHSLRQRREEVRTLLREWFAETLG
jgi:alpha/beta superfamily hydrolase